MKTVLVTWVDGKIKVETEESKIRDILSEGTVTYE